MRELPEADDDFAKQASDKESIDELDRRIKSQKGIEVIFSKIKNANHFFKNREEDLKKVIEKYIKEKTSLI